MTDAEREKVEAFLKAMDGASALIEGLMKPYRKALVAMDELREIYLEQHVAELHGKCESCRKILFVGDKGYPTEDGTFCLDCGPTYNDTMLCLRDMEVDGPDDLEEQKRGLDKVQAHLDTGGSLADKWPPELLG